MTMITQMMDLDEGEPPPFDPMDAITDKVLEALKPRKTANRHRSRKYKPRLSGKENAGADEKVFETFKENVLVPAAVQTARGKARELMDQLEAELPVPSRGTVVSSSALVAAPDAAFTEMEREFTSCMDVFTTLSSDIGVECRERGDLVQRLLEKVTSVFQRLFQFGKDESTQVQRLQARVREADDERATLQEEVQSAKTERAQMKLKLAEMFAKKSFLELALKQKSEEKVEQNPNAGRGNAPVGRAATRVSALPAEPEETKVEMVDGSTSPMMMFSSFNHNNTFMTGTEDEGTDAWGPPPKLEIPKVISRGGTPHGDKTRASCFSIRRSTGSKEPRDDDDKSVMGLTVPASVSGSHRGTLRSGDRHTGDVSSSSKFGKHAKSLDRARSHEKSFPSVLPFHNFVQLSSEWEFTHDPALVRAHDELRSELQEAQREVETHMTKAQRTEDAVDSVLRMLTVSVGRIQKLIGSDVQDEDEEDGEAGFRPVNTDLDAITGVLNKVLHELSCQSCHEWARPDVLVRLNDLYAEFDSVYETIAYRGDVGMPVSITPDMLASSGPVESSDASPGELRPIEVRPAETKPRFSIRSARLSVAGSRSGMLSVTPQPSQRRSVSKSTRKECLDAEVQTEHTGSVENDEDATPDEHQAPLIPSSVHSTSRTSVQDEPAKITPPNEESEKGDDAASEKSNRGEVQPLRRILEQKELLRSHFADRIDMSRLGLRRANGTLWPMAKLTRFIENVYSSLWDTIRAECKRDCVAPLATAVISTTCWDLLTHAHGASGTNVIHEKAMQFMETLSACLQDDSNMSARTVCSFVEYLIGTRSMSELTFQLYANALRAQMPRSDILSVLFGDMPRAHARGKEDGGSEPSQQVLMAYRSCEDLPYWASVSHAFVVTDCRNTLLTGKVSHCVGFLDHWPSGKPKSLGGVLHMVHKQRANDDLMFNKDDAKPNSNGAALRALGDCPAFKTFHRNLKQSVEMCDTWLADTITNCMHAKQDGDLISAVIHALMDRVDMSEDLLPVVLHALETATKGRKKHSPRN